MIAPREPPEAHESHIEIRHYPSLTFNPLRLPPRSPCRAQQCFLFALRPPSGEMSLRYGVAGPAECSIYECGACSHRKVASEQLNLSRPAVNRLVAGSNPARGAKRINGLASLQISDFGFGVRQGYGRTGGNNLGFISRCQALQN
jgi:hypothetical protein